MKKSYKKIFGYDQLLFDTVRERYFDLILGIFVFFGFSTLLFKNIKLPYFKFPTKIENNKQAASTINKMYTVKEGDDLWHIAEKFYGSGYNAYDISLVNKLDASLPLEPGQRLIIPKVTPKEITAGEISSSAVSTTITNKENKYIVQSGDSLSIIAQKIYGDLNMWPRILSANNLISPDRIEVGMVLIIPR